MVARRVFETASCTQTMSEDEHAPSMFPKQHNTQHSIIDKKQRIGIITTRPFSGNTISTPIASLLILFFGTIVVAIFNLDSNLFSSSSSTITTTEQTEAQGSSDPVMLPMTAEDQEEIGSTHVTTPAIIDVLPNDPRCKLILDPNSNEIDEVLAEFGANKEGGIGPPESYSVGPCRYLYPQRVAPDGGYTKNIDWYFNRTLQPTTDMREECFVQCLNMMESMIPNNAYNEEDTQHHYDMLAAAAFMGLQRATQVLMDKFNLKPSEMNYSKNQNVDDYHEGRGAHLNAIQAAITGGYAEIVKILTQSNMDMVIDEYGRTVKDYISMRASPIRPYYAQKVLGLEISEKEDEERIIPPPQHQSDNDSFGWNATTSIPLLDTSCDFDVIDTTKGDLSMDAFFKDYYKTGRPVVFRNHVSEDELKSFSKQSWSTLKHFHPTSRHMVGVTAYPR